jgi:hypothetical protein
MANLLQFVDSIASAPTVRLDLADGAKWNIKDFDFSPPKLKRARIATLMHDGDAIPATAYANRMIGLELVLKATTTDLLAAEFQKLNRELDRPNNILKWKSEGAGSGLEVFFRTFRSPDYQLDRLPNSDPTAIRTYVLKLKIEAEPFAYGLRETVTPTAPTRAFANSFFDISAAQAKGDVATPLWLKLTAGDAHNQTLLAVRRHGTPGLYWAEGEAGVGLIVDTTSVADAPSSGGSVARCTFATSTAMVARILIAVAPFSGAGSTSVEYRGTYRIFLRARKGTGGDVVQARWATVGSGLVGPTVVIDTTAYKLYDLGLFTLPLGSDPIVDGHSNTALAVESIELDIQAQRVSGTGNLDMDAIIAIPADEELSITDFGTAAAGQLPTFDGPNDVVYYQTAAGAIALVATLAKRTGDIAIVQPNQVNRYHIIDNLAAHSITGTIAVVWAYWPRFLDPVRP